ncbi:hypothetical protein LG301_13365 [Vreelandella venusta]
MYNAHSTQRLAAKPETAVGACAAARVSAFAFAYAGYWFSHGVPLADQ